MSLLKSLPAVLLYLFLIYFFKYNQIPLDKKSRDIIILSFFKFRSDCYKHILSYKKRLICYLVYENYGVDSEGSDL